MCLLLFAVPLRFTSLSFTADRRKFSNKVVLLEDFKCVKAAPSMGNTSEDRWKGKFKLFHSLFHSVYPVFPKSLYSSLDLFIVRYLRVICNEDKCCVVTHSAQQTSRRLACLRSHLLRAYCNFESKQVNSITLFGPRQNYQSIYERTRSDLEITRSNSSLSSWNSQNRPKNHGLVCPILSRNKKTPEGVYAGYVGICKNLVE